MTLRAPHTRQETGGNAGVDGRRQDLKALGVPFHYRFRLTNWLIAKPWKWSYRTIYRTVREPTTDKHGDQVPGSEMGRLRAAWATLTFPHVHHRNED